MENKEIWNDKDDFKIDLVIENPPYNNDVYIEFVRYGHKISKDNCVAITPARWSSKSVKNEQEIDINKQFRKEIVPYISKINMFIDPYDIFEIRLQGGISYYKIENEKVLEADIINRCNLVKELENIEPLKRNLANMGDKCLLLNETVYNVCNKVGVFNEDFDNWVFTEHETPVDGSFNVFGSTIMCGAGGHTFTGNGSLQVLAPLIITHETFYRSGDTNVYIVATH